ncbi:MAG: hypothetical protein IBX50_08560 [Marinospirillum sp.]|uniref:hypothetical protein n=1 Tax=Marinospirillum sp. TaxID=2183934 RepID=UPI0019DF0F44|nr:hypothetical protein [Marinospirillum sp.]MBE0506758.1 hypothetical protein [Marinospirillum sp.]
MQKTPNEILSALQQGQSITLGQSQYVKLTGMPEAGTSGAGDIFIQCQTENGHMLLDEICHLTQDGLIRALRAASNLMIEELRNAYDEEYNPLCSESDADEIESVIMAARKAFGIPDAGAVQSQSTALSAPGW